MQTSAVNPPTNDIQELPPRGITPHNDIKAYRLVKWGITRQWYALAICLNLGGQPVIARGASCHPGWRPGVLTVRLR